MRMTTCLQQVLLVSRLRLRSYDVAATAKACAVLVQDQQYDWSFRTPQYRLITSFTVGYVQLPTPVWAICSSPFTTGHPSNPLVRGLGACVPGGYPSRLYSSQAAKSGRKKSRKQQETSSDDDDDAEQGSLPEFDIRETKESMDRAIEHLQKELAGIRTGRANPGLLENITVKAHGKDRLAVKALGAVTVKNPQLLAVSVFDPAVVPDVVKAIRTSPLGLNPSFEGNEVLVSLPALTNESIAKMVKMVHVEAEEAKVTIRHHRTKAMTTVKSLFKSKDDRKSNESEVQKLHDKYIEEVERMKKYKEAELKNHQH